jgi:GTP-binding protein
MTQPLGAAAAVRGVLLAPEALPKAYLRYLTNSLRQTFDLPGVPIRLKLRKGDNPYAGKG